MLYPDDVQACQPAWKFNENHHSVTIVWQPVATSIGEYTRNKNGEWVGGTQRYGSGGPKMQDMKIADRKHDMTHGV